MSENAFGHRVRARREALAAGDPRAYSLRSVAAQLGVTPAYLSKVETGKTAPNEEFVRRLAAILGQDAQELIDLTGRVTKETRELFGERPSMQGILRSMADRPLLQQAMHALAGLPDDKLESLVRKIDEGEGEW